MKGSGGGEWRGVKAGVVWVTKSDLWCLGLILSVFPLDIALEICWMKNEFLGHLYLTPVTTPVAFS